MQFHRLQNARLLCPSLSSGVCSGLCLLSPCCYLTISPSATHLSFCFPSIRVFSNEFTSGGQSTGASASATVLSMNIQGWFFFRIGWFDFLQPKGLSRVQHWNFESISSLVLSLLYGPTLASIHHYWENHSFDIWLYRQISCLILLAKTFCWFPLI